MAKPKENSLPEELPDLSIDREQSFSNSFEDPKFDEMLPMELSLSPAAESPLVQEAAEAVHELLLDAGAGDALELSLDSAGDGEEEMKIETGLDVAADANLAFSLAGDSESAQLLARTDLAEYLFSLVVCEKPFGELVEDILRSLQKALMAEAGSVLEFDNEKSEFFFRATVGGSSPEKVKAFRVPANKGIVGHVAESRQGILLKSLETDQKQLQAISMSAGLEARSCVAAPIILDNQVFGVLEFFNKLSGESFSEQDLCLLEDGARMAAKVLEVRFLTAALAQKVG